MLCLEPGEPIASGSVELKDSTRIIQSNIKSHEKWYTHQEGIIEQIWQDGNESDIVFYTPVENSLYIYSVNILYLVREGIPEKKGLLSCKMLRFYQTRIGREQLLMYSIWKEEGFSVIQGGINAMTPLFCIIISGCLCIWITSSYKSITLVCCLPLSRHSPWHELQFKANYTSVYNL